MLTLKKHFVFLVILAVSLTAPVAVAKDHAQTKQHKEQNQKPNQKHEKKHSNEMNAKNNSKNGHEHEKNKKKPDDTKRHSLARTEPPPQKHTTKADCGKNCLSSKHLRKQKSVEKKMTNRHHVSLVVHQPVKPKVSTLEIAPPKIGFPESPYPSKTEASPKAGVPAALPNSVSVIIGKPH